MIAPMRVLIVEDSRTSQVGIVALLSRMGVATDLAETVDEALAKFDDPATAPHVVVLDLNLPGKPGEVLMEALAIRGLSPRVIVSTGAVLTRDRLERVRSLHPDVILIKPWDRDQFLAAVARGSNDDIPAFVPPPSPPDPTG